MSQLSVSDQRSPTLSLGMMQWAQRSSTRRLLIVLQTVGLSVLSVKVYLILRNDSSNGRERPEGGEGEESREEEGKDREEGGREGGESGGEECGEDVS